MRLMRYTTSQYPNILRTGLCLVIALIACTAQAHPPKFGIIFDYCAVDKNDILLWAETSLGGSYAHDVVWLSHKGGGWASHRVPIDYGDAMRSARHSGRASVVTVMSRIVRSPLRAEVAFSTYRNQVTPGGLRSVLTLWIVGHRGRLATAAYTVRNQRLSYLDDIGWTPNGQLAFKAGPTLFERLDDGAIRAVASIPPGWHFSRYLGKNKVVIFSPFEEGEVMYAIFSLKENKITSRVSAILGSSRLPATVPAFHRTNETTAGYTAGLMRSDGTIQIVCRVPVPSTGAPALSPGAALVAAAFDIQPYARPTLGIVRVRPKSFDVARDSAGSAVAGTNPQWLDSSRLAFIAPEEGTPWPIAGDVATLNRRSDCLYQYDLATKRISKIWSASR